MRKNWTWDWYIIKILRLTLYIGVHIVQIFDDNLYFWKKNFFWKISMNSMVYIIIQFKVSWNPVQCCWWSCNCQGLSIPLNDDRIFVVCINKYWSRGHLVLTLCKCHQFPRRIISKTGDVNCSSSSCDLTPLVYFIWGYENARITKTIHNISMNYEKGLIFDILLSYHWFGHFHFKHFFNKKFPELTSTISWWNPIKSWH